MSAPEVVVPIRSHRRARALLIQKIQHALPSVVLLGDGLTRVGQGEAGAGWWLGVAEIAVGAVVIVSFARALRLAMRNRTAGHHDAAHHGPDWLDLFLAAMLVVEALVHRHETGHLPRPTILLAGTMAVLGLAHGRITSSAERRRSLHVTDAGIRVGGRFFSRFEASWGDIAEVQVGTRDAAIVTKDGRTRRFDLADISNIHDVRPALEEIARRHHARLESRP